MGGRRAGGVSCAHAVRATGHVPAWRRPCASATPCSAAAARPTLLEQVRSQQRQPTTHRQSTPCRNTKNMHNACTMSMHARPYRQRCAPWLLPHCSVGPTTRRWVCVCLCPAALVLLFPGPLYWSYRPRTRTRCHRACRRRGRPAQLPGHRLTADGMVHGVGRAGELGEDRESAGRGN